MVTDEQVRLLRRKRMEGMSQEAAAAASGMSVGTARKWALAGALLFLEEPLAATIVPRVAALAALVVAGLAVFAVSAHLIGAANRHELAAMLRRRD